MSGYQGCTFCGKGKQVGHNVSHAQNRTKRLFLPNLQSKKVWMDTGYMKLRLCVGCLRMAKDLKLTPETRREAKAVSSL